jgi:hypothetical protein
MFDTKIVMLVAPVSATFVRTTLLTASDAPPKLTARLKLPTLFVDVTHAVALDSTPVLHFPNTELDDIHTDACVPLCPIRHRSLRLSVPRFDTTTVMLVDPVVAPFVGTTRITKWYCES